MENLAEFNLFTTKNFVIYLIIINLIGLNIFITFLNINFKGIHIKITTFLQIKIIFVNIYTFILIT